MIDALLLQLREDIQDVLNQGRIEHFKIDSLQTRNILEQQRILRLTLDSRRFGHVCPLKLVVIDIGRDC